MKNNEVIETYNVDDYQILTDTRLGRYISYT